MHRARSTRAETAAKVGELLRNLRGDRRLHEVARGLRWEINHYHRIELGHREPKLSEFFAICKYYRVAPARLIARVARRS